jgi:glycosyltransferase involved in cell wall biosynthesis
MPNPRRALLVRFAPYTITRAIPRLAQFLDDEGWEVHVLSLDLQGDRPSVEDVDGCRIFWQVVPYLPGSKRSFFVAWLRWWFRVIRHLAAHRYDVVHAFNVESVVPAILGRWILRQPYQLIFDVRDLWAMTTDPRRFDMRLMKRLERWAAASSDALLLSQGLLERTGKFFGERVRSSVPTVQVLNVPEADMDRSRPPPSPERIRVNFSGHVSYIRNARSLMELARARPHEVMIDVAGTISAKDDLREALSAHPNIVLHGQLPHGQAMDLMADANLVSMLYDTSREVNVVHSSNKMFEAMMLGRPYVSSPGGFAGIMAEAYGLGFVVPYGDTAALTALIDRLQAEPNLMRAAGEAARTAYLTHFTWDHQRQNLKRLYDFILTEDCAALTEQAGWRKLIGESFDPTARIA